jgi:hypothetical protein
VRHQAVRVHRALGAPAVAGDVAHPDRAAVLNGVGQRQENPGVPVAAVPPAHRLDRHIHVEQVADVPAHGPLVDAETVGQLRDRPGTAGLQ